MISLAPTISFHRYQDLVANELAECEGNRSIITCKDFLNVGIRLDLLNSSRKRGRIVNCLGLLHPANRFRIVENPL